MVGDRGSANNSTMTPGMEGGVERADEVRSLADTALNERISRLEARLATERSSSDAHVNALYNGMRALVAELSKRRRVAEETCTTLTRVLEATSDGFVALDADWRYTYVNANAGRLFGRDSASFIGKNIWEEFPDLAGQRFQREYELAVRDGTPRQFEAYYPPFDRWFDTRVYPYQGGLAIFFKDVTGQRLARELLLENEQRYRSLFDHHPDAVASLDSEGRFVSANASAEALTGYRLDELKGTSFMQIVVPENRERALERFRAVMGGSARRYEGAIRHKSGRNVEVALTDLPIVVNHDVVGVYLIARDLTARRELEARLRQAEKMEAIGRVASGIAHDFNNLLTIIQSCASFLERDLPSHGTYLSDLEEIQNASRRAAELTQQLMAFGRKRAMQPQVLDINQQVVAFIGTLGRVTDAEITLETQLAPNAWPVFADPGQLDRVLMNLGLNARDAMPNGGTLRVS